MKPDQKSERVAEFCQSIFELRYKLRRMFQVKLKEAGISISFEVLEVIKILDTRDGINQQEIADLLFKDKSSMTYLIDNMVKAGWATRKEDEADRRNKRIHLTPKAREMRAQLAPLVKFCFLALSEEVTSAEVEAGIQTLSKMNQSVADFL